MKPNRFLWGLFLIMCGACVSAVPAQVSNRSHVVTAFAILSTSLDSKTSSLGDEVLLTTISDITVDGKIVIPKSSKIVAHVGGAVSKGKDEPKSVLAIAIDKAVIKGAEIPLQAIIVAIAAPASKAGSTPVATAEIKGSADEPFILRDDSEGAHGYEDLLISWNLAIPPPLTFFATKAKNLKLHTGTQMLLRMIPPRLPG